MVDNRSAGFFGVGGAFNFKSGDISGTAAKTQDDKMGQGGEYFGQGRHEEEDQPDPRYMDRSAVLRATLNSLAMMNVANVINSRKRAISLDEKLQDENNEEQEQENKKEKEEELYAVEEHLFEEDADFSEFEDFDFAGELED